MISFICCSIRPEDAEALQNNIAQTIGEGVLYELIIHDNRGLDYGLCKVYNLCAERAQYDNLCFLHEDVRFYSDNWGNTIISKLSEDTCGVIGFAGSTIKIDAPSGWGIDKQHSRCNYYQHFKRADKKPTLKYYNPNHEKFAQVITLDGMALFVPRKVWSEVRFDDVTFTNFHCYDIDFTLAVSMNYCNYVCYTLEIIHLSEGNYSEMWISETEKMYEKWRLVLPVACCDGVINKRALNSLKRKAFRRAIKAKIANGEFSYSDIFKQIAKHPFSLSTWGLILKKRKYNKKQLRAKNSR